MSSLLTRWISSESPDQLDTSLCCLAAARIRILRPPSRRHTILGRGTPVEHTRYVMFYGLPLVTLPLAVQTSLAVSSCSLATRSPLLWALSMSGGSNTESQAACHVIGSVLT